MRRILLFWILAASVCALALRFVFPGYFDPFVPFHGDHYVYIGMHAEGFGFSRYFLKYPRPVAHVLIDMCGRLGVRGLLVPLYVLTLLNAALVARYVERVSRLRIAWPCFLLYAALAYSNPQFYWNLKQDPFAAFALTMLLGAMHCWQSYIERGRHQWLAAMLLLILLLTQTKESYFAVLALFLAPQAWKEPRHRVGALMMLLASGLCMGAGLLRSAESWVLFPKQADPRDPYYTSLDPRVIGHGFLKIGKYLAVPGAGAAILALLLAAWRKDRNVFRSSAALVLLGAAALLPNATLPNHLDAHYSFLGAYFFLAPLLLASHMIPASRPWRSGALVVGIAVCGWAMAGYQRSVKGTAGWLREQEQIARRTLEAIDAIDRATASGADSLIAGANMFYSPFQIHEFLLSRYGASRSWTVIVPDSVPEGRRYTTRLIHASNPDVRLARDHMFIVSPGGNLVRILDRPAPPEIAAAVAGVPPDPGKW